MARFRCWFSGVLSLSPFLCAFFFFFFKSRSGDKKLIKIVNQYSNIIKSKKSEYCTGFKSLRGKKKKNALPPYERGSEDFQQLPLILRDLFYSFYTISIYLSPLGYFL
uniref:Uncharacterized protein n=1 Tax=Cacopsylla melanoneura TaxID=428564 RepID=A0A8D8Y041_9HEMI